MLRSLLSVIVGIKRWIDVKQVILISSMWSEGDNRERMDGCASSS